MKVTELLIEILKESNGDGFLEVMIDSSTPKPFERFFEIKKGKGFLLLKSTKEKKKNG